MRYFLKIKNSLHFLLFRQSENKTNKICFEGTYKYNTYKTRTTFEENNLNFKRGNYFDRVLLMYNPDHFKVRKSRLYKNSN